jgi:solute:Na+ symporter, SSS family
MDSSTITLSSVSSDMAANFWRAWWAWLICALVTILISRFTKRKTDEELTGLVKGLKRKPAEAGISWYRRPVFYAVLSLIVLILLNIYFW